MANRQLILKPPPEIDPLESWHQEQIFLMAALNKHLHPELEWLYAVPNGGYRAKATAVAMQRQGAKPGVEDMALDIARGGYFGLRLELKRFRNGKIGDDQKRWLAWHQSQGYRAVVCWGWRTAWEEILGYIALPPTTVQ